MAQVKISADMFAGLSAEQIMARIKELEAEQSKADAFADAGISKTANGELMVTVDANRWPISLGKDDWITLLGKADLIAKAIKDLGIIQLTKEQRKALKEKAK